MQNRSLDFNILRVLSTRERFKALREVVPDEMLDGNTAALLGWFKLYFKTYEGHEAVDPPSLMTLIRLKSGNASPESLTILEQIVSRLDDHIDDETTRVTVQTLEELRMSGEVGSVLARFNNGEEVDLTFELQKLAAKTADRVGLARGADWADGDPLEYIAAQEDDSGIQFTMIEQLHRNLKGLRTGHNILVGAPTDAGKTSFLCAFAKMCAMQATTLYPDRPLLYLVNEGDEKAIAARMYQTALNVPFDELYRLARDGELLPKYIEMFGRRDVIRVKNIHQKNVAQVSRIIDAHNPYCVITDMTGRIAANSNKTGGKNDIGQLEEVWNCMRELATLQDFLHIGTAQVSAEGFNTLTPPLSALQDSKVGIQTTLDLVLLIGALTDPAYEMVRGISTPKNKLSRSGVKSKHNQIQVYFDGRINTWEGQTVASAPEGSNG